MILCKTGTDHTSRDNKQKLTNSKTKNVQILLFSLDTIYYNIAIDSSSSGGLANGDVVGFFLDHAE